MMKHVLGFSCILFFSLITNACADYQFEIVTHPNVNEENISTNSLRAIYSMHLKVWPNGKLIRVYVFSDNNQLHQRFSKEKLNVFPYQLRSLWDRLVFSGTGQAPSVVSSNDEMLAEIAGTPGAIGYIENAYINSEVSVLNVK